MAPGKNKKNDKIQGSSRKDQFVVLLENMRDEIKLVAEGNLMLQEKMERGFEEMKGEINEMKGEMNEMKGEINEMKGEINEMKGEMNEMRSEMRMGFRGMMSESLAADQKIRQKADKKDLLILEKRVSKLEAAR